jgi:hypothetical protein
MCTKEVSMRPILIMTIVLLAGITVTQVGSPARSQSIATLGGATPAASPSTDALATRVADLETTIAAQSRTQLDLALRVDALEEDLAPILEGLPDQALTTAFLQDQINDLQGRVSGLEASALATPISTAVHPLVGSWAIATAAGGAPGLISFGADGTVVVTVPGGGSGIGAWSATGPGTAVAVWVMQNTNLAAGNVTTAVRAQITVDAAGQTMTLTYAVLEITPRGSVAEHGRGTLTGVRVPLGTP